MGARFSHQEFGDELTHVAGPASWAERRCSRPNPALTSGASLLQHLLTVGAMEEEAGAMEEEA